MKKSLFLFTILLLVLTVTDYSLGQSVDLSVDQTRSDIDVSINSSPAENSTLSGTAAVDLASTASPFGSAQITALQIVLDQGLSFDLGPSVTGTTQPNEITITMTAPGTGGSVSGGVFDQLGNEMSLSGLLDIDDPNSVFGGSRSIDLSTIDIAPVDFTGNEISRVGNILTLSGNFLLNEQINAGGGIFVPLTADTTFVATGVAVPEPAATIVLIGCGALCVVRRHRKS